MSIKSMSCTFAGALGALAAYLFGEWSYDLVALMVFMGVDLITGIIVAGVFHSSVKTENGALSSAVTFRGILKKCVILLFVVIAHMTDMYLQTAFLRGAVIAGFMVSELISIVENAGLMGISSPVINEAIEILKRRDKRNE